MIHTTIVQQDSPSINKGIDICFKNVTYQVQVQKKKQGLNLPFFKQYSTKTLLDNVSGIFKAGQVTAIMGASGAGKTTLLNIIACRMDLQKDNGQLWANRQSYNYEDFGFFANYVTQADILMSTLTVRETLAFAANLKLDCPQQEKQAKMSKLAKQLKLQNCLDTLIGGQLIKGISGGERKRTSIAFELISDPKVLILDEPTSGLDSLTSFIIVQYLTNLSHNQNKTIIMTIHQPNSDIFHLFDKLVLMVEGKLIYQGPKNESVDYFDRSFGLHCPEFYNPADYFMSVMHHQDEKNRLRYVNYIQKYNQSIEPKILQQIQGRNTGQIDKRKVELSLTTTYTQLVGRDFKNVVRNPLMARSRFFQTTILYIYAGGMYYHISDGSYNDPKTFLSLTGFFFFLSLNSMMIALIPVTIVFPKEREIFLKEEGSKLYTTTAYFLSRNIIEIPYAIIFPLLQTLIVYWFIGLSSTATQFFTFFFILYLVGFNGMSLGLLLGSTIKDQKSLGTLAPALAQTVALISGYFKNLDSIPSWIGWIQYISPMRYSYQAFTENQVQFTSSQIATMNFNLSLWGCIGLLIALGVGYRLLSLFFLWYLRSRLQ